MFPTDLESIHNRIVSIQPIKYGKTRNFQNGAVTRLSPYISRGVISSRDIMNYVSGLGLSFYQIEKLIQELAWRDYWQQIWIHKGDAIFKDIRHKQSPMRTFGIPTAVLNAETGIDAVDTSIRELYETGYMHNHMRMYVASICCNIAQCHWYQPAQWLYAHLIDGDLASNMLSWQWVAGTNSNKKYVANQENINKYFNSTQRKTFLDVPYSDFEHLDVPEILNATSSFELDTTLPSTSSNVKADQETCVYNYYNLDPEWHKDENVQRVYLIEPDFFDTYPISQSCLDFSLKLAYNIADIKLYVGSFNDLKRDLGNARIYYKEHPTCNHYRGVEETRDWMFSVEGDFRSFFGFWKKCKKELKQ